MINAIATVVGSIVGTVSIVITGGWAVLKGFYKTNKDAEKDYKSIEEKIVLKINSLEQKFELRSANIETSFDSKIEKLEKRLEHEYEEGRKELKQEFQNIANKIDDMKSRYVTNTNFKTYAESVSQLLKMSTDRMTRIESTLDDIRDDINSIARHRDQK